ncbi:MAG: hypothetical protein AB1451_11705 [Nitrospirota bacterium]
MGAILLVGCGVGGGTPTDDLICRGSGVIVGGKVTFIKRLYNERGLTGGRDVKPVRHALVEMVLEVDGRVVGTSYTDENGNYCVQARGVPIEFPAVYPRVATRTNPSRFKIAVVDSINNPQASLYSRPGASLDGTRPGTYNRDIAVPVLADLGSGLVFPLSGAFNILDVATEGAEAAIALAGRPPSAELLVGWTPGTVFGSGTIGTYFVGDDPTQRLAGIELSGGAGGADPDSGDHDEFDDDVILHEFGHFMAYSFSKPAEAGGTHYLNDNTQDIRLAWSEGWATFFSAAVRNRSVMVNTRGGDPGHPEHDFSYSFEIETPHSDILSAPQIGTPLEDHGIYTTSEVSVSSVLWDLYDSRNESGDRYAMGLQGVWDLFTRLVTAPSNVSLETLATLFENQVGPSGITNLAATAKLRRVQFFPDEYETGYGDYDDNQMADAPTVGPGVPGVVNEFTTCHTLYPAGDVDFVRIQLTTPRSVTIETFNLSNGADTVVQLLDANGNVVQIDVNGDGTLERLDSDNAPAPRLFTPTICGNRVAQIPQAYFDAGINNGARLASTVSTGQVVLPAGTYYGKVISRATAGIGRNPAAGTLGSYDLIVTLD